MSSEIRSNTNNFIIHQSVILRDILNISTRYHNDRYFDSLICDRNLDAHEG